MNANRLFVLTIYNIYKLHQYCRLQAISTGVDMFKLQMPVMFIPCSVLGSWLQGSSLKGWQIIIRRSYMFRAGQMKNALSHKTLRCFFSVKNALAHTPFTPSKACASRRGSKKTCEKTVVLHALIFHPTETLCTWICNKQSEIHRLHWVSVKGFKRDFHAGCTVCWKELIWMNKQCDIAVRDHLIQ